jgi:glutamate synthase (NADPH/NADH) large chain
VNTVVEGVGDHGCEYMTGGRAIILGATGRNFAAGMSGGIAYVYDVHGNFADHCNTEMVNLEECDADDAAFLKDMLEKHLAYTDSSVARFILSDFESELGRFIKVFPQDYKRVLQMQKMKEKKEA